MGKLADTERRACCSIEGDGQLGEYGDGRTLRPLVIRTSADAFACIGQSDGNAVVNSDTKWTQSVLSPKKEKPNRLIGL